VTVVVGGGIAGLTAAWAMAREGRPVTLVERESRLGGKIRTERVDGFVIEHGPDSFLVGKPAALELCRELGLGDRIVAQRAAGPVRVWARNGLHPLPAGVRLVPTRVGPLLGSPLLSPGEALRAAADLVLPAGAARRAGDISLAALVAPRMGRAVLDRIVAPVAAGIHAADPSRMSVEATFPRLFAAAGGSLMRGLRGKRDAVERAAFVSLDGGMDLLVDALAEALRTADVRLGRAVLAVESAAGGYAVRLDDGETLQAETLVLAVPPPVAARLLAPLAPLAARLLSGIGAVSTAAVALGYRQVDVPSLDGPGFVVARDRPARITACTWASSKWPGRAPPGHVLLRGYLGRAGEPLDPREGDAALVAAVRLDLAQAMGIHADPLLSRVARWPGGTPQLDVGHVARLAAIERDLARRAPRVVLAGAGYRGTGLPDCVAQGRAAARRVNPEEPAQDVLQRSATAGDRLGERDE